MPKETFLNLSHEKKNKILEAALKEFSVRNIHEASVANIVRDSNIARGSFYKYFEDIEDLYAYMYHLITDHAHLSVIESIKAQNGDLFKGLEDYLHSLLVTFSKEKYHDYFKVITLNLNHVIEKKLTANMQTELSETSSSHFIQFINTEHLKISSEQEMIDFFKVLVPTIHECLNEYFEYSWSQSELFDQYHRRIKWLQYGILK